ncbi:hypothetical protein SPSIL_017220 [Sporomusa silvacetica DSM 10669]|uniref:Uncharacterized protein n=2 Tax=Sporomusa silvacetica TaxID=55504 RepID=A0ABZ3IIR1_9FIRM|nr:hypothetical protein SPSIL_25750 [Sporomusa silvacetica DSM 10669]
MMPLLAEEAKERKNMDNKLARDNHGKFLNPVKVSGTELDNDKDQTSDKAGKLVGISGATIRRTEYVERHGTPELVDAMKGGYVKITTANKIATNPKEKQNEILQQIKENPKAKIIPRNDPLETEQKKNCR